MGRRHAISSSHGSLTRKGPLERRFVKIQKRKMSPQKRDTTKARFQLSCRFARLAWLSCSAFFDSTTSIKCDRMPKEISRSLTLERKILTKLYYITLFPEAIAQPRWDSRWRPSLAARLSDHPTPMRKWIGLFHWIYPLELSLSSSA